MLSSQYILTIFQTLQNYEITYKNVLKSYLSGSNKPSKFKLIC